MGIISPGGRRADSLPQTLGLQTGVALAAAALLARFANEKVPKPKTSKSALCFSAKFWILSQGSHVYLSSPFSVLEFLVVLRSGDHAFPRAALRRQKGPGRPRLQVINWRYAIKFFSSSKDHCTEFHSRDRSGFWGLSVNFLQQTYWQQSAIKFQILFAFR